MEIINEIDDYLSKDLYKSDFFQLYSFTTENINSYMPFFDLKNKSLLTIGSSSDQAINATLEKCNDITVCDICPLTKYFYNLKVASLLVLNREDFLNFFCSRNRNKSFLSKTLFNRVKTTLKSIDYESYLIWEYLFNEYNKNDIEKLFRTDINDLESILYCNRYLKNDNNYNQARGTILNTSINFIIEDITKLNIDKSFDNIWLSNIANHLNSQEIDSAVKKSIEMLNNNGKILLCYFWNTSMTVKGFPIEELSNIESEKIKIQGISKLEGKNSILVYTKKI